MSTKPIIVWFRRDLRIADQPALYCAATSGRPVLPLFILDDEAAGIWAFGAAQRWFLDQALRALDLPIVLRRGDSAKVLNEVIAETGADAVYWNRRYEPFGIEQDRTIKSDLKSRGLEVKSFASLVLHEPWKVLQNGGAPYKVYTPYSRTWLKHEAPRQPLAKPQSMKFAKAETLSVDQLELKPKSPDWSGGIASTYKVNEAEALQMLDRFGNKPMFDYAVGRNRPDQHGTSWLSAYLATGLISPHQIYAKIKTTAIELQGSDEPALPFLRQLIWRDFATSNLYHYPELPNRSLRQEFENYPWLQDDASLKAWQHGQTGYPIVDAGMRQLWQTGYMHNRVRMIAGSFLTKDLRIHWREGAKWFWDTLVDADLGNNSMGWQWVAGCGIDAAPYFRIFNPTTQGEKFDPEGNFVRRYVPELASLPTKWIHRPSEAPLEVLRQSGVRLGQDYPRPMVDHKRARDAALEGFQVVKSWQKKAPPA